MGAKHKHRHWLNHTKMRNKATNQAWIWLSFFTIFKKKPPLFLLLLDKYKPFPSLLHLTLGYSPFPKRLWLPSSFSGSKLANRKTKKAFCFLFFLCWKPSTFLKNSIQRLCSLFLSPRGPALSVLFQMLDLPKPLFTNSLMAFYRAIERVLHVG